jgi:UDP-N-acetylglucosamine 2-epimerase
MRKLLSIVGVRPQFVKAAMLCSSIERWNAACAPEDRVQHLLLNTGQHYDFEMAEVFFRQLPLPEPDFHLNVGSGSHGAQTGAMLQKIEEVLLRERPDYVIVYGDTNSTLAGALAAVKLHIPVAHVESGLRSFNRRMPEEINRITADHVSDLLFCPTLGAVQQLRDEGVSENVFFTGDVMLDAVQAFAPIAAEHSRVMEELRIAPHQFVLATIHRAENTDSRERLEQLVETLCRIARPTVFAVHPRLRMKLQQDPSLQQFRHDLESASHLRMVPPLPYLDMLALEANARLVLTDSGGVQKEAYFLTTPCITLRDETEWTETLLDGWNTIAGTSPDSILPLVENFWSREGSLPGVKPQLSAFGDGKASDRILDLLQEEKLVAV